MDVMDSSGKVHGFLLSKGDLSTTDFPDATSTYPFGINRKGEIAGVYNDASGEWARLLAQPGNIHSH
jgi:hypothetical protein